MGRLAVTGFIVFVVAPMLVSNLPDPEFEDEATAVVDRLLDATANLPSRWHCSASSSERPSRAAATSTVLDGKSDC